MKGKVSIGRMQRNDDSVARIDVRDETSGVTFFRLEMSAENFGNALLGLSIQECDFTLDRLEYVGKVREVKEVIISVPPHLQGKCGEKYAKARKEYLQKFEFDGWVARANDFGNLHHSVVGQDAYRVTFVRFVDGDKDDSRYGK